MMQAGSTGTMWTALLDETRAALATLHADELEELAERAQQALALTVAHPAALPSQDLRELTAQHRLLGEVLEATAANLAVTRRVRGGPARGDSPWDR